jgi:hypothetical protein
MDNFSIYNLAMGLIATSLSIGKLSIVNSFAGCQLENCQLSILLAVCQMKNCQLSIGKMSIEKSAHFWVEKFSECGVTKGRS